MQWTSCRILGDMKGLRHIFSFPSRSQPIAQNVWVGTLEHSLTGGRLKFDFSKVKPEPPANFATANRFLPILRNLVFAGFSNICFLGQKNLRIITPTFKEERVSLYEKEAPNGQESWHKPRKSEFSGTGAPQIGWGNWTEYSELLGRCPLKRLPNRGDFTEK